MDTSVYSPRKKTPQNQATLPSTHSDDKRISYMQITLNEDEIIEACQNYIRAQVPVDINDEMPTDLVAGRGENGHSATITITPGVVTQVCATQPSSSVPTFTATAEAVARRNGEAEAPHEPAAPSVDVTSDPVPTTVSPADTPQEPMKPATAPLEVVTTLEKVSDTRDAQPAPATPTQASELFSTTTAPTAEVQPAPADMAPTPAQAPAPETGIFD